MRKIGMRVLVAAMIAASIMFASCKYDTEPEDNKRNENTEVKLSIVWKNWASENDYIDTDGTKKIFISDYIYGTKEVKRAEDLADLNDYFYDIDLSKYDSEYKEKMGLGDKNLEKETIFAFDTNKRYIYDSDRTIDEVYICSFTYYSDEGLTDKIDSVVMDADKTVYAKAHYDLTAKSTWNNYVNGVRDSYK